MQLPQFPSLLIVNSCTHTLCFALLSCTSEFTSSLSHPASTYPELSASSALSRSTKSATNYQQPQQYPQSMLEPSTGEPVRRASSSIATSSSSMNNNNKARVNGQLGRNQGSGRALPSSDQMSTASNSSTVSVTESNPSSTSSYQHQHLSSSNSSSSNTSTAQAASVQPPHPFVPPPLFCVPSAIVGSTEHSSILHSTSSNLLPVNFPVPVKEGGGGFRAVGQPPGTATLHSTNTNLLLSSANAASHSLQQHTSGHILAQTTSNLLLQDNKLGSTVQSNIASDLQQSVTVPAVGGSDFKTCIVKMGEVTTIEIVREKLGLGLSIVGGSDTPLVSVSIITFLCFLIC